MSYRILFLNEDGDSLQGELVFLNAQGVELGATGIHVGGSDISDTDIPVGTVLYHAVVPGYRSLTSENVYETSTFTLVKETPVVKYMVLGGLAVGAAVLLSRYIKL